MTPDHKLLADILTRIIERRDNIELAQIKEAKTLEIGQEAVRTLLGGAPSPLVTDVSQHGVGGLTLKSGRRSDWRKL